MTPKAECEVLMKEVLAFAEQMLRDYGEFHPFGGTIDRDGGIALVGGVVSEMEFHWRIQHSSWTRQLRFSEQLR
jgi:hypothetical protein